MAYLICLTSCAGLAELLEGEISYPTTRLTGGDELSRRHIVKSPKELGSMSEGSVG